MKLNEVIAKYGNQEVDESKIKEVLGVKESKVWKPAKGGDYYYFTESGFGFTQMNIDIEESPRWNFGNCFKTKQEAKFAREKQIFLTRFERYLRENEDEPVEFNNSNQKKYNIIFDIVNWVILLDSGYRYLTQGAIYTTNRLALEQFITENEADIKKYMFGVE